MYNSIMDKNEKFIKQTINWINGYLIQNNIKSVVIGLSGGIDSAVSLAILKKIKNIQIFAYFINIESNNASLNDAILVANYLNQELEIIDLNNSYLSLIKDFKTSSNIQKGNIKSRMRMMFLYDKAYQNNAIVVGNSNYDEIYLGYCTKFGDQAVDIMLLNNLLKEDIISLAKYLSIPQKIINKKPSADLYKNQFDEDEIGFSYNELDKFLNNQAIPIEIENKIKQMHDKNLHKQKIVLNPNTIKNDSL